MFQNAAILFGVALASGCTSLMTQSVRQFGADYTLEKDPAVFLSSAMAIQIRAQADPSNEPLYTQALLYHLKRLTAALPKSEWHYRVSAVQLPMENAFAIGDGQIYFTEMLMDSLASNEELVGILAHEIGHTELKHSYERLDPNVASDLSLGLLAFVRDQKQEFEADRFAIELLSKAGYRVDGLAEMLDRHEKQAKLARTRSGGLFLSHPASEDRSKKIRDQINALGSDSSRRTTPIPTQYDLVQVRRRLFKESKEYGKIPTYEEDVERNPDLPASVREELLQAQSALYSGWQVSKKVSELNQVLKSTLTEKHQAIVHLWIGRLKAQVFDIDGARASFEAAAKLAPGLQSPRFRLLIHLDSESEKKALWKKYKNSCGSSLDCLSWSVLASGMIGVDPEDRVLAAADFRKALIQNPASENLANLSPAFAAEIDGSFYQEAEDRPDSYDFPKGYEKPRQVTDLLELNKESIRREWVREMNPRYTQLGIGFGNFGVLQKGQNSFFPSAMGMNFDYYVHWGNRFSGFRLNGGTETFAPGGPLKSSEILCLSFPLGLKSKWGSHWIPWTSGELGFGGFSVERPGQDSKFIARGFTGRASVGLDYLFPRLGLGLSAQAFMGRIALNSSPFNSGALNYWGLSLGISALNFLPAQTPEAVFSPLRSPVFY
ncbi:MAG: M48 family metallopeptidase [Bdellovibrionales bacterium]|nr:M48 family metallopeptidase [Bdellovibrionales bacterium]